MRGLWTYKNSSLTSTILTTLAFWLRSSVVSVLNRLTSIMEALPPLFGYQIFAALVPMSSACNSGGMMTLLLQYWLVLSGDSFAFAFFLLDYWLITIW